MRAFDRVIQIAVVILGVVVVAIVVIASIVPTRATTAQLNDAQGNFVGTALFTQSPDGVRIYLASQGLEPGEHGIHFHEKGKITPDFKAAGKHFNPTKAKHGLENPKGGPHAGDLENITVVEDGTATYQTTTDRVTLSKGKASLLDEDGSSLVIHQKADDHKTDDDGKSGERIAAGVIEGS